MNRKAAALMYELRRDRACRSAAIRY